MKRILKQIKSAASAMMSIASVAVMILAFGAVDIKEWSWIAIAVYFAALAWIVHAIKSVCKGGVESVGQDSDIQNP